MHSTELFRTHPVYINNYHAPAKLLILSETDIVLLDLGESMWQKVLFIQFGLIGGLILGHLTKKQQNKSFTSFSNKSIEEILSGSTRHQSIPYDQVTSFKVVDGGLKNLGQRRIELHTSDKKYNLLVPKNDFDTTTSFLRQFLRVKEQG